MPKSEHNWNPCEGFNFSCLACGCYLFNIMSEATEEAQKDCPGRTPEFQAQRDASFAALRDKASHMRREPSK